MEKQALLKGAALVIGGVMLGGTAVSAAQPVRSEPQVVTVPGPERIVWVPGPERIVQVPGPERIVQVPGPERKVEVPVASRDCIRALDLTDRFIAASTALDVAEANGDLNGMDKAVDEMKRVTSPAIAAGTECRRQG